MTGPLLAVEARISEQTPRDRRGVRLLGELAADALGRTVERVEGRDGPYGETPWRDDLAASRDLLATVGGRVEAALARGQQPLTLAPDCALALGTLPAAARAVPGLRVLWLDAHSDYDTPETSSYSFLGAMALAGAVGAWDAGLGRPLDAGDVVLCGPRTAPGAFDEQAQRAVEASAVRLVPLPGDGVVEALGGHPTYVHLDPDVLDPAVNPIPYGRPGGLTVEALLALLAAVARTSSVVGVEITAFHSQDAEDERRRVGALLAQAAATLLGLS